MNIEQEENVTCPVCSIRNAKWLTQHRLLCSTCGSIFEYPLPSTTAIFEHHQAATFRGTGGGNSQGRFKSMEQIANFIVRQFPDGGTLLDIGCADGSFFKAIRNISSLWRFWGIDPIYRWTYPDDVQFSNQMLRHSNYCVQQFDVITLLDSIFYLTNLHEELAEIRRILKPNGFCIFDHPGMNYLRLRGYIGKVFRMNRLNLFDAYPLYLSNKGIGKLMQEMGFQIVSTWIVPGLVHPSRLTRKTLQGYTSMISVVSKTGYALEYAPKLVYITRAVE